MDDGIKHIYKTVGIYRVTATAENSLGSEAASLYLHVTCEAASGVQTSVRARLDKSLFSLSLPLSLRSGGIAPRSELYLIAEQVLKENKPGGQKRSYSSSFTVRSCRAASQTLG